MAKVGSKLVPPDGGWGWIIMVAFIITQFIYIPVQQNFGLLYKETFQIINLTSSDVTSIISTNLASESLTGLITAPLIRRFKIRSVSFTGAILFCGGLLSTINANGYLQFLLCYGIVNGVGAGLLKLTTNLSLNLYFRKRRHKVVGFSMGVRSLGSVLMPQLIVVLFAEYGVRSTLLFVVGISLHMLCMSLLFHPVEWHAKPAPVNEQDAVESLDLLLTDDDLASTTERSLLGKIVHFLDLEVLKHHVFLTICFGITFAVFSDLIFSTLLALILTDLTYTDHEIAAFVSVGNTSSITVRILVPFVGDFLKRSSRFMYMIGAVLSIMARFAVIYSSKSVAISVLWGAAKGVTGLYWNVMFADNVPPKMLASAESIMMVVTGLLFLFGGSLLGFTKDVTGNYVLCVYILNAFSCITCVLWILEVIYKNKKRTNKC